MTEPTERPLRLRAGALTWRVVENQVVVLDLERAEYLAINASGTPLWELLVEGATRAELMSALVERFGVQAADAERDVDMFLAALSDRHLLDQ
jgi:hypothetical protein